MGWGPRWLWHDRGQAQTATAGCPGWQRPCAAAVHLCNRGTVVCSAGSAGAWQRRMRGSTRLGDAREAVALGHQLAQRAQRAQRRRQLHKLVARHVQAREPGEQAQAGGQRGQLAAAQREALRGGQASRQCAHPQQAWRRIRASAGRPALPQYAGRERKPVSRTSRRGQRAASARTCRLGSVDSACRPSGSAASASKGLSLRSRLVSADRPGSTGGSPPAFVSLQAWAGRASALQPGKQVAARAAPRATPV